MPAIRQPFLGRVSGVAGCRASGAVPRRVVKARISGGPGDARYRRRVGEWRAAPATKAARCSARQG